jgi:drug/metabolite transporter (DMT)-like permease
MIFLLFYTFTAVAFSQLFHFSQRRGGRVMPVAAVNYLFAAGVSVSRWAWTYPGTTAGLALGTGVVNGAMYFIHLLVLLASFRIAGVGISMAVVGSSTVVPVLVSWLLWQETLSAWQWVAMAMVPVSVTLLRPPGQATRSLSLRADIILLANFVCAGTIQTLHKAVEVHVAAPLLPGYNATLFAMAAATSLGYALWYRLKPSTKDVAVGLTIGIVNALTLVFILLALARLPAAVFFPVGGITVILMNLLVSRILWRERVTRRQAAGVAAAMLLIVLVRL